MKIVIAPDKFKGSLSAAEAAGAIARGMALAFPEAEILLVPIADGGEGTMQMLAGLLGAEEIELRVHGPLGDAVSARYALGAERAVIEMSAASGLMLVPPGRRDPWRASTFGTGELISDALRRGAREVIVGIGGSATNEGGMGMARALGFEFQLGADGFPNAITPPGTVPRERASFTVACDVANPLLGADGCTRVYGPQKGIAPEEFERHEGRLQRLVDAVHADIAGISPDTPGAGAAGGLGFGLMAFCGAELRSGFDLVAEFSGLGEAIRGADLVITGEGSMDAQTLMGKGPAGVAQMARAAHKPVVAFCGIAREERRLLERFDQLVSLESLAADAEDSITNAAALLERAAAGLTI